MLYAASSPIKAQQYSHAFAQAYLQVRTDQGSKAIAAQTEKLTTQLDRTAGDGRQVQR